MQQKMRTRRLDDRQMAALLSELGTGSVATVNQDGTPYVAPVHFVFLDGRIYFHGLPVGKKLDNIKARPDVCFNAYVMQGLLHDAEGRPCKTGTGYQSVTIQGKAAVVDAPERKREVLDAMVRKYTPHLAGHVLPDEMVAGTAVVEITVGLITGKYGNELPAASAKAKPSRV